MQIFESLDRKYFSDTQMGELRAYDKFLDKYHLIISQGMRSAMGSENTASSLNYHLDERQYFESEKKIRALQKSAIHSGAWDEYCDWLNSQGAAYARQGVELSEIIELHRKFKESAINILKVEYQSSLNKVIEILHGQNLLMDFAIGQITRAYLGEFEQKYKTKTNQLDLALKVGKIGIWVWNMQTGHIEWDQTMYELFDLPENEFKNRYEDFEKCVHPEDRKQVYDEVSKSIASKSDFFTEFRVIHRDQSIRYLTGRGRVTYNLDGNPVKMTGTNMDITDIKLAEERLKEFNSELEKRVAERTKTLFKINRELEDFSYTVSHDLRAPLRAINGFASLLSKRTHNMLNDEEKHFLHSIKENGLFMGHLIDDLLSFSRMSRIDKNYVSINMNAMIEKILTTQFDSSHRSNMNVEMANLPSVKCDQEMIRQVWTNLIDNAIKFSSHQNQIQISIGAKSDSDEIIYYIKDNGIGFDMVYERKIFEIFQRLEDQDTFQGTGVGLAIVQRIINRHGGKVWAKSKPGAGSTFYFSIPKHIKNDKQSIS